jgi:hypothetical protein
LGARPGGNVAGRTPAEATILHAALAQRSSRRYGMKKINETGRAPLLLQRY